MHPLWFQQQQTSNWECFLLSERPESRAHSIRVSGRSFHKCKDTPAVTKPPHTGDIIRPVLPCCSVFIKVFQTRLLVGYHSRFTESIRDAALCWAICSFTAFRVANRQNPLWHGPSSPQRPVEFTLTISGTSAESGCWHTNKLILADFALFSTIAVSDKLPHKQ